MVFGPKRVVRPMTRLPKAVPIEPVRPEELPTLRQFYENYVAEHGASLPRPRSADCLVFVPSPALRGNRQQNMLDKYVLKREPGVSLWPKTFDLRYDNLCPRDDGRSTDYAMSRAVHDREAEYAYVQSVTIDGAVAGIRISKPVRITDRFKKQICRDNVRHKIFALASLLGRIEFHPVSLPHIRLVWLLNAFHERYGRFPEIVNERVNEYEKSAQA